MVAVILDNIHGEPRPTGLVTDFLQSFGRPYYGTTGSHFPCDVLT